MAEAHGAGAGTGTAMAPALVVCQSAPGLSRRGPDCGSSEHRVRECCSAETGGRAGTGLPAPAPSLSGFVLKMPLRCAVRARVSPASRDLPSWTLCSVGTANHNYTLKQEAAIDILSSGFFLP